MRRVVSRIYGDADPPANIWLGVSIESNDYAWRADMLRQTPAAVRFVSCEPLLERIPWAVFADGIDWVIVGGESGPGHRPMSLEIARDIRDGCASMHIPFFFKQVSAVRPNDEMIPPDLQIREYPA